MLILDLIFAPDFLWNLLFSMLFWYFYLIIDYSIIIVFLSITLISIIRLIFVLVIFVTAWDVLMSFYSQFLHGHHIVTLLISNFSYLSNDLENAPVVISSIPISSKKFWGNLNMGLQRTGSKGCIINLLEFGLHLLIEISENFLGFLNFIQLEKVDMLLRLGTLNIKVT